jgi:ABC-type glycerol-3-phosphate transport system substrate-binding protein
LGTGNNIDNGADILSLLMMQNGVTISSGGQMVLAGGTVQESGESPVLQSLRFYTDFARPTKDVYSWNAEMPNAFDSFISGRSVFYFGYAFDAPRIRSMAPQLNMDIIPIPQLNSQSPSNVANYWLESVVKKSTHQNEAWDFIRFITSAQNVKTYTDITNQPSPLRAQIATQKELPAMAPFVNNALTAINWYEGRNYEAAKKAFSDLMVGYLAPYGEREEPGRRDIGLVRRAVAIIQQTY